MFKPGDKVKRIAGGDYYNVKIGGIYTVENIHSNGFTMKLKECPQNVEIKYFKPPASNRLSIPWL